ncbi:DUF4231 domain-containing protein [bacterium]|nr:MAG: DUF4231 domain-containing protein [bacterium]
MNYLSLSKKPRKNANSHERSLKGPNSYDKFNKISLICQSRYLNIIRGQNVILVLIAFVSSLPIFQNSHDELIRCIMVILAIVFLGLMIFQQSMQYMTGWQKARFLAESILSNSWLFCFKIGVYNADEKNASATFLEYVEKTEKDVDLNEWYSIYTSSFGAIAEWMHEVFVESDFLKKKSFYITYRLKDQLEWYTERASDNFKRASRWHITSLVLLLAGIVLTMLIPISQFSIFGFLSTITATSLTWRQTRRFEELRVTYAITAKELESLKYRFELEVEEKPIFSLIMEAEKLISREHKLWFNRSLPLPSV